MTDTHWFLQDQKLSQDPRFWEEIEAVFSRIGKISEPDLSFTQFIERYCADVPDRVKGMALAFVEGFDAAHPERAGVRGLAEEQEASAETEEERSFRVINGYDRVIEYLAAGLDATRCNLRLSTIVTEVRWQKDSVHVAAFSRGVRQTFEARCVLVTVPLGVLKAGVNETGAIRFTPELLDKREAIARLEMGSIVKIILQFREPFWETEQFATLQKGESLRDACFLHAHGPRVFTWWTMLPVRGTCWSVGRAAPLPTHYRNANLMRSSANPWPVSRSFSSWCK